MLVFFVTFLFYKNIVYKMSVSNKCSASDLDYLIGLYFCRSLNI